MGPKGRNKPVDVCERPLPCCNDSVTARGGTSCGVWKPWLPHCSCKTFHYFQFVYLVKLCQVLKCAEIWNHRRVWAVEFTWKSTWRTFFFLKEYDPMQKHTSTLLFARVDCCRTALWLRRICELARIIPELSSYLSWVNTKSYSRLWPVLTLPAARGLVAIWLGDDGNRIVFLYVCPVNDKERSETKSF